MIVYGITPLAPEALKALSLSKPGVRDRLFVKPSRTESLTSIDSEGLMDLADGFTLRVQRNKDDIHLMHPIEALLTELTDIRNHNGPDTIRIPGQAFSRSYTAEDQSPAEGVVVVLFGSSDWESREIEGSELDWDPIPALFPLHDPSDPVSYQQAPRGSYITADGRGLIIDYDAELDHAQLDTEPAVNEATVDDEVSPFLIEFALQHAVRSIDIARAAACIDTLGDQGSSWESRREALDTLRMVQLRMAARGVESLIENREWQSFLGHDSFRFSVITRRQSGRLDRELSEQFTAVQPIIEAADADLQLRTTQERESRVKRVTGLAGAVIGGAALIGLFAALAAIPDQSELAFNPYLRAAFATVALGAIVAGYAWLLQVALPRDPVGISVRWLKFLGGALVSVGIAAALIGLLWNSAPTAALLVVSLGSSMMGILALTYASGVSSQKQT